MCGVLGYWCCDEKAPGCSAEWCCVLPKQCPQNNCNTITCIAMPAFSFIGGVFIMVGAMGVPMEERPMLGLIIPGAILLGVSFSYYCYNIISNCCCVGGSVYDKYREKEREKLLRV